MRVRNRLCIALGTLLLAGCGSGGGDDVASTSGPAQLSGTLAYVVSECTLTSGRPTITETLRVQRGDTAAIDVMEFAASYGDASAICPGTAETRSYDSRIAGAFPRLAVSPDGSRIVFELSDDFSLTLRGQLETAREGFYAVNTDGSGLRRLAPSSGVASYFFGNGALYTAEDFRFAPNGRTVVYADFGPGPNDEEAVQIVILDIDSGERRVLTHFPIAVPSPDLPRGLPAVGLFTFLDDTTIAFLSYANPDDVNPRGDILAFSVRIDASAMVTLLPDSGSPSGGSIDPSFRITGPMPRLGIVHFQSQAVGPPTSQFLIGVQEVFLRDADNLLQLTNYRRADTFALGSLSRDGERAFFIASADPLGENPTNNCQLFSIDRTGGNLLQVTHFSEDAPSDNGCTIFFPKPRGCYVEPVGEDQRTGSLLLHSTCDPFGTNPNGDQIFAIRPDGTGLRQLTTLSGYRPDGSEGPGIVAFAGPRER